MNKHKISLWIFVLANAVIAYAGLNLGIVFSHIFEGAIVGGMDALPSLSKNFIRHGQWFLAFFTIPLLVVALVVSLKRTITSEDVILFGAVTFLNISLQVFFAAVALSQPFIPVFIKGSYYSMPWLKL